MSEQEKEYMGYTEDEQEELAGTEAAPETFLDFLADNPVTNQTEEITLCERLKNFTFKIGSMTKEQRTTYTNVCMIKAKSGKVMRFDNGKFNELMALNHTVYPNFNDLGFIQKCGCRTPAETLYKVLKVGEVELLAQKIMEFNGFDTDFEDLRKQAKN